MLSSYACTPGPGVYMAGLRGSNVDTSDFAARGQQMQLVELDSSDDDRLPLVSWEHTSSTHMPSP